MTSQLSQLYNTVQSSAASLAKLFTILDTEPDIVDGERELPPTGALVVDEVGFRYPGTDALVLRDVSLRVAEGDGLVEQFLHDEGLAQVGACE